MAARDPLDHYNIGENDDCTCRYCIQWRERRDVVNRSRMVFDSGRCKCENCKSGAKNTIRKCASFQKAQRKLAASKDRRALSCDSGEDEVQTCACKRCEIVRRREDSVNRTRMMFDARRCKCLCCVAFLENTIWKCLYYQKRQYSFLAAANRRELWIEMSYHAAFGTEQDGVELMKWLDAEIRSMERTPSGRSRDGWWGTHAERHSLDWWFCKFDDFVRAEAKKHLTVVHKTPT